MEDVALINDPIHGCIPFTYSSFDDETTEKTIIDDPWLQRLRQIYQLQSTRWVFPSAEHTRFQHSIGTMYLASRFINKLYEGLKNADTTCPSKHYIEELVRVAGLLHDVGHGPLGHFCDQNYLETFGFNHELIGQAIITTRLADKIKNLKRSPYGSFSEEIDSDSICFLIRKPNLINDNKRPVWLKLLRNLFSNIVTVDNLDYILRDSYFSGVHVAKPNIERILFYLNFKEGKFVIHQKALHDIKLFIESRLALYKTLYYHRTVRIIDLQIRNIYSKTLAIIMNGIDPRVDIQGFLDRYLELTDWSLFCKVKDKNVLNDDQLFNSWQEVAKRKLLYVLVWDWDLQKIDARGIFPDSEDDIYRKINNFLPKEIHIEYKVDMARQDPRPETLGNIINDISKKIFIEDFQGRISEERLVASLENVPQRIEQLRVFIHKNNLNAKETLEAAIESASIGERQSFTTNV